MHTDLMILDYQGYSPFSQVGGALLFHLIGKFYEKTIVIMTTNLVSRNGLLCSVIQR